MYSGLQKTNFSNQTELNFKTINSSRCRNSNPRPKVCIGNRFPSKSSGKDPDSSFNIPMLSFGISCLQEKSSSGLQDTYNCNKLTKTESKN